LPTIEELSSAVEARLRFWSLKIISKMIWSILPMVTKRIVGRPYIFRKTGACSAAEENRLPFRMAGKAKRFHHHKVERTSMVPKGLRRILFIAVPLLLAASTAATAQEPSVPAGRLHHSGVYDENSKEFVTYGGYTWNQSLQKVQSASDVWGWNGGKWVREFQTFTRGTQREKEQNTMLEQLIGWAGGAEGAPVRNGRRSSGRR
jgi:hypothetical protein